jgi:hypothetical protein
VLCGVRCALCGLTLVLMVAVLVAGALAQVVAGEDGVAPALVAGASAQVL